MAREQPRLRKRQVRDAAGIDPADLGNGSQVRARSQAPARAPAPRNSARLGTDNRPTALPAGYDGSRSLRRASPGDRRHPPPPSTEHTAGAAAGRPLHDVLADGGAVLPVVEADGDAAPQAVAAPLRQLVGAEALPEVLVAPEAGPQLHGGPHAPGKSLPPAAALY